MKIRFTCRFSIAMVMFSLACIVHADDSLETRLKEMPLVHIVAQAQMRGDAKSGALVFYKSAAACVKCHATGDDASPLGPDLATIGKDATGEHIVESILHPSRKIRDGFGTVTILSLDGRAISGLVAEDNASRLVLRDAANLERSIAVDKSDIDQMTIGKKSMMPEGLVASLRDERQFYDLVRYLMEIAKGGSERARELKPDAEALIVVDDTTDLDHAGILSGLGERDLKRGEAIYVSHCQNCHGADGNTPALATARAFGTDALKYGADPYKMFRTLSLGNGLMSAMTHLTPKERYQVVYYIREAFMKANSPQYAELDNAYLASLPKGTGNGEADADSADRDYGPVLGSQIGNVVNNGLTFRLKHAVTVAYDLHRMRLHDAWRDGFLDLSQTHHYRGRGERMPQVVGEPIPGLGKWQWAYNGSFEIPSDAKAPRGPLRDDWMAYHGHYLHGDQAVLSYAIHGRQILETITSDTANEVVVLQHTLRIDAGESSLQLCVGQLENHVAPSGIMPIGASEAAKLSGDASHTIAIVSGTQKNRRGRALAEAPKAANRPRHLVPATEAKMLDLGTPGRTILVRFRTQGNGTLVASAPKVGNWAPNGKTLFLRGGRVVFDIGWVGAMTGKSNVADGQWHTAALVVEEQTTTLYVDGKQEARRERFRRDPVGDHVLKIGATATNFGGDFTGDIDSVRILDEALSETRLRDEVNAKQSNSIKELFVWNATDVKSHPDSKSSGASSESPGAAKPVASPRLAVVVDGDTAGLTWQIDDAGRINLSIPASSRPRVFRVIRGSANGDDGLRSFTDYATFVAANEKPIDPSTMTQGGPTRWPERISANGTLGESLNGYALDTMPIPNDNPWNAWIRTSALDFFDDGRAVVTTHGGDVYIVSGIDQSLSNITWQRFTAGLFEPFGVRVVDGTIYVTCRDGIKRLHDFDGNGEADFIEAFWIDEDVSCSFHAYNFDLQTDSEGNFYFAKAGQYTQHHRPGSIMRIPPEGGRADVVAWGVRTPNGMGKLADDRFTVSDNQGPWMPAGKISLITADAFLGNMPINEEQTAWLKERHGGELPTTFDEPMIWMPQELDNSCGGQVWVDDKRFGPLSGRLIHSSFGKGWLYYLSMQEVNGRTQASIVSLPHQWDAGVMRLRVNPKDGQLYGTGLAGWQGPAGGKDGCLQRLRYTGQSVRMIDNVQVTATGLELTFNFALDPDTAKNIKSWQCEMWDYLWSRRYGSDQFSVLKPGESGRDRLAVSKIEFTGQNKLHLTIPDLKVCDQLSLQMQLKDSDGELFIEHVYLTIHAIPER